MLLLQYHRTWSLRLVAVHRSESHRIGRHLHLLPLPNSNPPWIPWRSARDNVMQRDGLSRWNTSPLTARTQEARQALFHPSRQTYQSPEPAEQEQDQRLKDPWRLCLLRSDLWYRAKRSARKLCRLHPALARAELPRSRQLSLPSPPPADLLLVEPSLPGATRTVSRLLLRLQQRLHKATSLGQSLDPATSFLGPCHRLWAHRKLRLVASTTASTAWLTCNPVSKCRSQTSAATSAAPPWEASQTGCLGAATHADSPSLRRKVARLQRSETAGTRPSA